MNRNQNYVYNAQNMKKGQIQNQYNYSPLDSAQAPVTTNNEIPLNNPNFSKNDRNNKTNNNSQDSLNILNQAFEAVKGELLKKDKIIKDLQGKIIELENKIQVLQQTQNNNQEIKSNKGELPRKDYMYNKGNEYANDSDINNFNKKGYESDQKKEDSIFKYADPSQNNQKNEIKNYLKEVKGRVNKECFSHFIKNIKLLTSKNNANANRRQAVENVKELFGEQHQDLYEKFEVILGIKNINS